MSFVHTTTMLDDQTVVKSVVSQSGIHVTEKPGKIMIPFEIPRDFIHMSFLRKKFRELFPGRTNMFAEIVEFSGGLNQDHLPSMSLKNAGIKLSTFADSTNDVDYHVNAFRQYALGMLFCHAMGLSQGDVKTTNVVCSISPVNKHVITRLIDMGRSCPLNTLCGTPNSTYVHPSLVTNDPPTKSIIQYEDPSTCHSFETDFRDTYYTYMHSTMNDVWCIAYSFLVSNIIDGNFNAGVDKLINDQLGSLDFLTYRARKFMIKHESYRSFLRELAIIVVSDIDIVPNSLQFCKMLYGFSEFEIYDEDITVLNKCESIYPTHQDKSHTDKTHPDNPKLKIFGKLELLKGTYNISEHRLSIQNLVREAEEFERSQVRRAAASIFGSIPLFSWRGDPFSVVKLSHFMKTAIGLKWTRDYSFSPISSVMDSHNNLFIERCDDSELVDQNIYLLYARAFEDYMSDASLIVNHQKYRHSKVWERRHNWV